MDPCLLWVKQKSVISFTQFSFYQLTLGVRSLNTASVYFIIETKEDRHRQLNPKLLFPVKAWLRGFLPGHHFSWEEDYDETDVKEKVKLTLFFIFSLIKS